MDRILPCASSRSRVCAACVLNFEPYSTRNDACNAEYVSLSTTQRDHFVADRNIVVRYLVDNYLQGSIEKASTLTGYTQQQVRHWISGDTKPRNQTIDYLVSKIFFPEFKVIVEFAQLDSGGEIRAQLKRMLSGH